jgi:HD-like signal output (HDOD) protein
MTFIPRPNEREVRHAISQVKDLPLLPGSLPRMLEIIQEEIFSAKELESLVRYDQSLSARILRVANSAYRGYRGTVRTLSEAMWILGFDQARSMCLCALLVGLFTGKVTIDLEERERLWKHGFATARMARELARKRPWISEEEAYILGLFHDLGWVVMAAHLSEYYDYIQNLARSWKVIPWHLERQCGVTHTRIGKWVAIKWSFPEVFQKVIEFHHNPENSPSFKPEVTMISLADLLVNSKEHPDLPIDEAALTYRRELCITDEEWKDCWKRSHEIWLEVDQFWDLLRQTRKRNGSNI